MRVITGSAKGKSLKTLSGNDTRPTSDKVKEAIFSALQFEIEGADVLDLFAGSGQLGIEALSRGAKSADFADGSAAAVAVVRENLAITGLAERATVSRLPYDAFLRLARKSGKQYGVAFIDPPYGKGLVAAVLPELAGVMARNGAVVCEHEKQAALPEQVGGFEIDKAYNYGSVCVTIYRNKSEGETNI